MTVETKFNQAKVISGELTYDDKVIEKIVGLALSDIPGLLAVSGGFLSNLKDKLVNSSNVTDGVHVEVGKKQVAVDLAVIIEYQQHVPTIFEAIKTTIESQVKAMTDLDVIEVNVKVVDIKTKTQHQADSVSLQDRVTDAAHATGEFASHQVDHLKIAVGQGVEKVQDLQAEPRVK